MKSIILVAILGVVGLGFYLGWFHLGSQNNSSSSDVTLTVDKDKMSADGEKAKDKVQGIAHQAGDKVEGAAKAP